MARIRTVKPSFFTDEDLATAPLTVMVTFPGLWTHCDDEGRCLDDARLIKAAVYPLRDGVPLRRVEADLTWLAQEGKILRYEAEGKRYIQVVNWHHQRISKPQASLFPAPPESAVIPEPFRESTGSDTGTVTNHSPLERKGIGKEGKPPLTPPLPSVAERSFAAFWQIYPRHVGKEAAHRAWQRAIQRTRDPQRLLDGARRYASDPNLPADRQFIPYPATWLNQGRWDDEPLPPRPLSEQSRTERNVANINAAVDMVYGAEGVNGESGRDPAHPVAPQRGLPSGVRTG